MDTNVSLRETVQGFGFDLAVGAAALIPGWFGHEVMKHTCMLPNGKERPVMMVPGYTSPEFILNPLGRRLTERGCHVKTWGIGQNTGGGFEKYHRDMCDRLHRMTDRYQKRVFGVGHSLGGLFMLELAHEYPDEIECVATLGSPIHDFKVREVPELIPDMFRDNVMELQEYLAGFIENGLPPVPIIAISGGLDRIVPGKSGSIPDELLDDCEYYRKNVHIPHVSHMSMVFSAWTERVLLQEMQMHAQPFEFGKDRKAFFHPEGKPLAA